MTHLIVEILNNPVSLGILCFALVMFPIIGIAKIHEPPNESNRSRPSSDTETVSGDDR
jgi:hypothetical protein